MPESPTSMKMKNTFLLQHNNPSFDNYAVQMKRRNTNKFNTTIGTRTIRGDTSVGGGDPMSVSGVVELDDEGSTLKIDPEVPQARDGHSCLVHKNMLIVFGGDRHYMPFNDLAMLDLDDFFFDEGQK